MIHITHRLYNQLVEWTKAEKPNEASGYLFCNNDLFLKIITVDHSHVHFYDRDPAQLLIWIERWGKPTAIFHSHPGVAVPSSVDREYMKTTIPFWECIWLIMSNKMVLRAWSLLEITLRLIELEVEIIE